jgi:hypothetical protein
MNQNQTQSKPADAEQPSPEGLSSSALLAAAENLHRRAHEACPFMTLNTGGPDGIVVKMKFKNYDDAADVHSLLVKFFSANTYSRNPHNGN